MVRGKENSLVELPTSIPYNSNMLSPQFYSQLTICPACLGFGIDKNHAKNKIVSCEECGGLGVYYQQSDQTFIWGLPCFIDFRKREKIKVFKIILFTISLIFLLLVVFLLSQIQIPKLGNPTG